MPASKTKPTRVRPAAFIARLASERQRKDSRELVAMMREITGEPPKMWGPSIVGFGTCHYVYASGREGDICLAGFSPRKSSLVLYIGPAVADRKLMSKLGSHKAGKGCLYVKTLDDVNGHVLRALVTKGVADMRKRWATTVSRR